MFLTNTQLFLGGVDYCDVFISCLDSHSEGTHSLQRIYWWASDVMLHFSKSVATKKQTHLHLRWPEGEYSFIEMVLKTLHPRSERNVMHHNWYILSPSHRTLMSQWQSSISCTGTGTQTSSGFSAIEKHWKIRSSHRFYGLYASKMGKRCAWGTCNTDSMYPERMGNIIYLIKFPESKQNQAKCPLAFNPNTNEDKTFIFWLSYTH